MIAPDSNNLVRYSLRKRKEIQNLSKAFTEQIPSTLAISINTSEFGERKELSFFQNSILDIVCFSVSRLVRKFPRINARYNDELSYLEFS